MRVVVVGGTGFGGRAIARALVQAEHNVTVIHRGEHEVEDEPPTVAHLHVDRNRLNQVWLGLRDGTPDVLVDVAANTRDDARAVVDTLPLHASVRFVVLSSMDVYAAWESFVTDGVGSKQRLDETAPLRRSRYLYRGESADVQDYEKQDVEEEYAAREATVLSLPMVYGEHDDQRREEFILRRCRAGRRSIPSGPGTLK